MNHNQRRTESASAGGQSGLLVPVDDNSVTNSQSISLTLSYDVNTNPADRIVMNDPTSGYDIRRAPHELSSSFAKTQVPTNPTSTSTSTSIATLTTPTAAASATKIPFGQSMVKIIDIQRTTREIPSNLNILDDGKSRHFPASTFSNANYESDDQWRAHSQPRQQSSASNTKKQSWDQLGENLSSFESDYDLLVYLGETETEDIVETERSLDYQDNTWRQSICGGASLAPTIDDSLSEVISPIQLIDASQRNEPEDENQNTPTNLDITSPFVSPSPRSMNELDGTYQDYQSPEPMSMERKQGSSSPHDTMASNRRDSNQGLPRGQAHSRLPTTSTNSSNSKIFTPDDAAELDRLLAEMSQTLDLESLARLDPRPEQSTQTTQLTTNVSAPKASRQQPANVNLVNSKAPRAATNQSQAPERRPQTGRPSNDMGNDSVLGDYDDASRMLEEMISGGLASQSTRARSPSSSAQTVRNIPIEMHPDSLPTATKAKTVAESARRISDTNVIYKPPTTRSPFERNHPAKNNDTEMKAPTIPQHKRPTPSQLVFTYAPQIQTEPAKPYFSKSLSEDSESRLDRKQNRLRYALTDENTTSLDEPPEPPAVDYGDFESDIIETDQQVIEAIPVTHPYDHSLSSDHETQIHKMKRRTLSSMRSMRNKFNDFISPDQKRSKSQADEEAKTEIRRSRSTKRREPIGEQLAAFGQRIRRHLSRSKSRLGNLISNNPIIRQQRARSTPNTKVDLPSSRAESEEATKLQSRSSSIDSSLSGLDTTGSSKRKVRLSRSKSQSRQGGSMDNKGTPRSSSLLSIRRLSNLKTNGKLTCSDQELEASKLTRSSNEGVSENSKRRSRRRRRKYREARKSRGFEVTKARRASDSSTSASPVRLMSQDKPKTGEYFGQVAPTVCSDTDSPTKFAPMRPKSSMSLSHNQFQHAPRNEELKTKSQSMKNIHTVSTRQLPGSINTFQPFSVHSLTTKEASKNSHELIPRVTENSQVKVRPNKPATEPKESGIITPTRPPRRNQPKSGQTKVKPEEQPERERGKFRDNMSNLATQLKQSAITVFQLASPGPRDRYFTQSHRGTRLDKSKTLSRGLEETSRDADGEIASLCHWTPVIGSKEQQKRQSKVGEGKQPKSATLATDRFDWDGKNHKQVGAGRLMEQSKGRDEMRNTPNNIKVNLDDSDSTWDSESNQSLAVTSEYLAGEVASPSDIHDLSGDSRNLKEYQESASLAEARCSRGIDEENPSKDSQVKSAWKPDDGVSNAELEARHQRQARRDTEATSNKCKAMLHACETAGLNRGKSQTFELSPLHPPTSLPDLPKERKCESVDSNKHDLKRRGRKSGHDVALANEKSDPNCGKLISTHDATKPPDINNNIDEADEICKKPFKFHQDLPEPNRLMGKGKNKFSLPDTIRPENSPNQIDNTQKTHAHMPEESPLQRTDMLGDEPQSVTAQDGSADVSETNRLSIYENVPPKFRNSAQQDTQDLGFHPTPERQTDAGLKVEENDRKPKPKPKLVTMTSIIQDPNDELMVVSCSPPQALIKEPIDSPSKTNSKPHTQPLKFSQRQISIDLFDDDDAHNNSDESDSSMAGPKITNRQKLIRQLEQKSPYGSGHSRPGPPTPMRKQIPRLNSNESSGCGSSIVKRMAKNFDQVAQASNEASRKLPPASTRRALSQMTNVPSLDEDSKSETTWYDARSVNTDLDEAEVADFLRNFDRGSPGKNPNATTSSLSVSTDQFVTVDEGDDEDDDDLSVANDGAEMENYDDNDDTLNDGDKFDGDDDSCCDVDEFVNNQESEVPMTPKVNISSQRQQHQTPKLNVKSDSEQTQVTTMGNKATGIPIGSNMVRKMASRFDHGNISPMKNQASSNSDSARASTSGRSKSDFQNRIDEGNKQSKGNNCLDKDYLSDDSNVKYCSTEKFTNIGLAKENDSAFMHAKTCASPDYPAYTTYNASTKPKSCKISIDNNSSDARRVTKDGGVNTADGNNERNLHEQEKSSLGETKPEKFAEKDTELDNENSSHPSVPIQDRRNIFVDNFKSNHISKSYAQNQSVNFIKLERNNFISPNELGSCEKEQKQNCRHHPVVICSSTSVTDHCIQTLDSRVIISNANTSLTELKIPLDSAFTNLKTSFETITASDRTSALGLEAKGNQIITLPSRRHSSDKKFSLIIDDNLKNSLNQILARRSSTSRVDVTTKSQQESSILLGAPERPDIFDSTKTHNLKFSTQCKTNLQSSTSMIPKCHLISQECRKELKGLRKYYYALWKHGHSQNKKQTPPVLDSSSHFSIRNGIPASRPTGEDKKPILTSKDCLRVSSNSTSSSTTSSTASSPSISLCSSDDECDEGKNLDNDHTKLVRSAKKFSHLYDELEQILAKRAARKWRNSRRRSSTPEQQDPIADITLKDHSTTLIQIESDEETSKMNDVQHIHREIGESEAIAEQTLVDEEESCDETLSTATEQDDQVSLSSSPVPPELLNEIRQRKNLQKLYHIVNEIYSSEAKFVDTLVLLNIDFRNHMQQQKISQAGNTKSNHHCKLLNPLFPQECVTSMLKHLPPLLALNQNLLEELKIARDRWPETQRVAHVLVKIGPFLKHYSTYIREFESIRRQFLDNIKKYPQFAERVREFETNERCQKLTIQHHLLKPIQRIPQYRLLLKQYIHHLKPEDVDYDDTVKALEVVSQVAEHANQSMNEGANFAKLLAIQARIINRQGDIVQPGRVFIKEGELMKICRKQIQPRWFVLLNDALLYLTQVQSSDILYLNNELSLDDCQIFTRSDKSKNQDNIGQSTTKKHENSSSPEEREFSVCTKTRSFTLIARSPQERDEWMNAFKRTIDEYLARRRSFSTRKDEIKPQAATCADIDSKSIGVEDCVVSGGIDLGQKAPLWTPDSRVSTCQLCTSSFSALFRRHHCRACGRVVCSACSSNRAPLVYLKFKSARVCDECFDLLKANIDLYQLPPKAFTDLSSRFSQSELHRLEEHFRVLVKSQFVKHAGLIRWFVRN